MKNDKEATLHEYGVGREGERESTTREHEDEASCKVGGGQQVLTIWIDVGTVGGGVSVTVMVVDCEIKKVVVPETLTTPGAACARATTSNKPSNTRPRAWTAMV